MIMNTKMILVKALLLFKQNETFYFLELIRSPHKKFPLMGDLPGGKVDASEMLITAIHREILEETGLSVFNLHEITVYD